MPPQEDVKEITLVYVYHGGQFLQAEQFAETSSPSAMPKRYWSTCCASLKARFLESGCLAAKILFRLWWVSQASPFLGSGKPAASGKIGSGAVEPVLLRQVGG